MATPSQRTNLLSQPRVRAVGAQEPIRYGPRGAPLPAPRSRTPAPPGAGRPGPTPPAASVAGRLSMISSRIGNGGGSAQRVVAGPLPPPIAPSPMAGQDLAVHNRNIVEALHVTVLQAEAEVAAGACRNVVGPGCD